MKDNFRTHLYQSPLCLFIIIALSITAAEYSIMFGFRFLSHFSSVTRETIDAALLFAISSPIIYFFVYRPLKFQITEREKAKRNWEVTFDSIKDPLHIHDSEYRIIQANKAYMDIAGMPFKDMIGRPYYEVFPKTGSPLKSCVGALELQEGREEEITISDINKIFRVRFYHLYDANKYYNSIHIFEDITERKRIENELKSLNESLEQRVMERSAAIVKVNETLKLEIEERKRAEEKLKKYEVLFTEANDLAYICDRNGNILFVNKIFERLTGHRTEEFMGKPFASLFDENNLKKAMDYYTRTLKGESLQFELYFKDTGILCEYKNIPSRDKEDNITGVMGIARDITQRKRMEKQLRETNESLDQRVKERTTALSESNKELELNILELKQMDEKLTASEEKFRQIVEYINEIFWMTSIDGKEIIYTSPAYEIIWGRTCKSLYDNPSDWINAIHPEDLERAKTALSKTIKLHHIYDEEYRIVRADKSIRWIHDRGFPVKNAAGEIYRFAGIAEDVTDKKLAEEEIKKLNSLLLSIRNINEALLKVNDASELFNKISGFLLDTGFIKFAWIGLIENEGAEVKPVAKAGLEHGYLSIIKVKLDDPVYGKGPSSDAIKTGEPIFINDVESDKRYKLLKGELTKRGFASIASIPLRAEEKVMGILGIYADTKDAFGEEEKKYLVQVAGDIGIGYKSLMLEKKLKQSVEDLRTSLNSAVEALSLASEYRDPYTAGHEKRVAQLACAIAAEIGFDAERLIGIRVSAFLHDIGKIAVPAEILSKPTALTEHEYGIIKTHPKVGFEILKNLKFPWPVAQTTLQHHETLNGSGYPLGMKGDKILMEARILAVADAVEAMANHRPYRPSLGIDKALEDITHNKGILYEPGVADACVKLFKEKGFRFVE